MYFATYLFAATIISWQRLLTIDDYKKIIVDPLATLKNQHISFVESKTRFYTYFVERCANSTKRLNKIYNYIFGQEVNLKINERF